MVGFRATGFVSSLLVLVLVGTIFVSGIFSMSADSPTALSTLSPREASLSAIPFSAEFQSVPVSFTQCANDRSLPAGQCDWIGSILQSNNSVYFEGMSVPQRILYRGVGNGNHTISFSYTYTKGGIHAYDFITTLNQGNAGFVPGISVVNKCQGLSGPDSTACTAFSPQTNPPTALMTIPYDSFDSKDSAPFPGTGSTQAQKELAYELANGGVGSRKIQVYSTGTFTPGVVSIGHDNPANGDTGDSDANVSMTFSLSACPGGGCNVLIYFDGHLAVGGNDNNSGSNWGPGLGSSFINGGPYHIKNLKLDGSGGSQDNPIQGADILPPPADSNIVIIKDTVPNSSQDFNFTTTGGLSPSSFLLDDDSDPALKIFQQFTGLAAGTYSVTEALSANYALSNLNCVDASGGTVTNLGTRTATISLAQNETVTCTFTNSLQTGLIIVDKITQPSGDPQSFDFTAVGTGYSDFSLMDTDPQNEQTVNAGNYSVIEEPVPGWILADSRCSDGSDPSAITLSPNEEVKCLFLNVKQPRLTVTKIVINDDGGDAIVSDFPLFVDGNSVTSGVENYQFIGNHVVSELNLPGYTATISGDCDVNGNISLAAGDDKECIITNDDQQPRLTVTKVVVNDNGGTAVVSEFPLFVNDTLVTSGVSNDFNAGAYVVSEETVPGYTGTISGDCDANGNVELFLGDDKSCTITNDDNPAHLIVIKHVINDNGGTSVAADFNMEISGVTAQSGNTFPGAEDPGVDSIVTPGAYEVMETGPSGYAETDSEACSGTIALGETKTCTITNDDVQPLLTVTKIVINDNGGTAAVEDFVLFVNDANVTSGVQNGFDAGQYLVSETNLPGYESTISGDCDVEGSVTLVVGDEKECTITNDDIQSTLTVTKVVVNDNGGTAVLADFPLFVDDTSVVSGVSNGFDSGPYVVSEENLFGYTGTITGDCDANGNVTLGIGENKSCTITNDDIQPELTVTKVVINDNGGEAIVSDFPLFVNATSVVSGATNGFDADDYVVSETPLAGYAGTISGDCDAQGNVTLSVGESKSCTITNDDVAPTLTLVKTVVNDNGGTAVVSDFPLFIDGNSVTSGVANVVNAGAHTASETNLFGYTASDWSGDCAADGSIVLSPGDEKTCTITNDDVQPLLTVIKVVINDNGGTAIVSDFALFVNDTNVTSDVQNGFDAGAYLVSETPVFGYTGVISGDCDAQGNVSLNVGDEKVCTITNNDVQPTLTVNKIVINDNGGEAVISDFPLFVNDSNVVSGETNGFDVGSYLVSETSLYGYVGTISGDCDSKGNVSLGVGENKVCTITNDDVPPTLIVTKIVVNDNGGTAEVEDFALFVDANSVISGASNNFNAGTYFVSETQLPGYTGTISGACDVEGMVTLNVGDEKECTITNDDIQSTLTVTKVVVNDNGGTAVIEDFPLFVDDLNVTSGETNGFNAGIYTVSETNLFGYTGTISGDCDANGSVTLGIGENKFCTVTNDDQQPNLTITKVVVNDNGGEAIVSDFALFVDDMNVTSGETNGFDAGAYVVSETPVFGYTGVISGDCDLQGTVTLSVGESKECTITNDDVSPQLTVIKHVINDNGGDAVASDFTMNVTGTNVSLPSFAGDENGTLVTLDAGLYSADEIELFGYTKTMSEECSGTIAVGESRVCTITNDDISPSIILIKEVINDNGGTADVNAFGLTVGGSGVNSGDETFVNANTPIALDEAGLFGYTFVSITGDEQCPSELGGTVTLNEGEQVTCTITNNDVQPELIVIKHVINDHGGTASASDFTMNVTGTNVSNPSFPGDENGTTVSLDAGAYDVNELIVSGYASSFTEECSGTVSVGETKTCTITNDDVQPTITVTKVVINDNGGTAVVEDFTLMVNDTNVISGETNGFDAEDYLVSETTLPGYVGTISGDCDAQGNVSVSVGDNAECVITNDDVQPLLTVTKVVINDNGGTAVVEDFALFVDANIVVSGETNGFDAGSYLVSETNLPGYTSTISGDCDVEGSVTLSVGDVKECVITNDDIQSTLTVTKIVTNDNGGTAVVSDFALFVNDSNVTSGESNGFNAGTYLVSETPVFGYTGVISGDCDANGGVTLGIGENKSCIITNDDVQPLLTVTKVVVNNNGGTAIVSDFPLFVNDTNVLSGVTNGFNAGSYTVSETPLFGYTGVISGDCDAEGNVSLSVGDSKECLITNDDVSPELTVIKHVINNSGGTATASQFTMDVNGTNVSTPSFPGDENGTTVTLDAGAYSVSEVIVPGYIGTLSEECVGTIQVGQTRVCTIVNDDNAATLTVIKHVINDNNGTAVASDFNMTITGVTALGGNTFAGAEAPGVTRVLATVGDYNVTESTRVGYAATFSADCSGTIALGESRTCTITNNDTMQGIRGFVFNDVYNQGLLNLSLPPLVGWEITITGDVNTTAYSGPDGHYSVLLPPGQYTVCENPLLRWVQTYPSSGYACGNGTVGYAVDLSPGEIELGKSFGNYRPGRVQGYKFNDVDGDSIWDAGEPGLRDWNITITGGNYSQTVQTDVNGRYQFDGLLPGTYSIMEQIVSGWTQTFPVGTGTYRVTIQSQSNLTGYNFGNRQLELATRTQGFWSTHTAFTSSVFQNQLGGTMNVGTGGHIRTITNIQAANSSRLFGAYYSSIPFMTTSVRRTPLDQARMRLLQQLVTAKLNCAAFTCEPNIMAQVAAADTAYAGNSVAAMNTSANQMQTYNVSRDGNPIPGALGNPGAATPALSQSYANRVFWDAP